MIVWLDMLFRVNFPPKFFGKIFCLIAHAFEVVKVLRGYVLQDPSHARECERHKSVTSAREIEPFHKVLHKLAALCDAIEFPYLADMFADMLHDLTISLKEFSFAKGPLCLYNRKMPQESLRINGLSGEKKLKGSIAISGAKNAALPAQVASLLSAGTLHLRNVPQIEDVSRMNELLEGLGAKIARHGDTLSIDTRHIGGEELISSVASRMRASVFLIGPLLHRRGRVRFPHPGGDVIGARPIDIFLSGLHKMGARTALDSGWYEVSAKKLRGADIFLPIVSVGATETLLMAATLAEGGTVLRNAAMEPEVVFLSEMLRACGAKIKGEGTPTIVIEGVSTLSYPPEPFAVIPDRIEAGSYLVLGALLCKELALTGCEPEHLRALISLLKGAGVPVEAGSKELTIHGNTAPNAQFRSINVRTHEYPGFATDLQAPMTVFLTQAAGEAVVSETIFDGRLSYTEDLVRMGADITLANSHRAFVKGPRELMGRELESPDIRAGLSFVIAALVANGESLIHNAYHMDRGYERIEEKLKGIGAQVERVVSR